MVLDPETAPFPSFNISRVAVIGAGAAGMAMAKELLAEKKFVKIELFEQRPYSGGTWNYTPFKMDENATLDLSRDVPSETPDPGAVRNGSKTPDFVSPLYDMLETNIPHTLMNFSTLPFPKGTCLFPPHRVVSAYLQEYARPIEHLIHYHTQVLNVVQMGSTHQPLWEVTVRNLATHEETKKQFDAVAVASGHYSDPYIPRIRGLKEFAERHPGSVSHAKYYDRPEMYTDKKVLVIGYGASGIDISAQISTCSKLPLLLSESSGTSGAEHPAWARPMPQVEEVLPETRSARFQDGSIESDIDYIIFCTGYHYSFPFLGDVGKQVSPDGSYVQNVFEYCIYVEDPTLVFIALPQRVIPFPISEAQACYIARAWANRLALPGTEVMRSWVSRTQEERGDYRLFHNLAFPRDAEYINHLYHKSVLAKPVDGLENGGLGRNPVSWSKEAQWHRERIASIKSASQKLGMARRSVTTLEQLGFDYKAWERDQQKQQLTLL